MNVGHGGGDEGTEEVVNRKGGLQKDPKTGKWIVDVTETRTRKKKGDTPKGGK